MAARKVKDIDSTGSFAVVAGTATTVTVIGDVAGSGEVILNADYDWVTLDIHNDHGSVAYDDFNINFKMHKDGAFVLAYGVFTASIVGELFAPTNLVTLASGTHGLVRFNVSGVYSFELSASGTGGAASSMFVRGKAVSGGGSNERS
jgi:hypothetical protein